MPFFTRTSGTSPGNPGRGPLPVVPAVLLQDTRARAHTHTHTHTHPTTVPRAAPLFGHFPSPEGAAGNAMPTRPFLPGADARPAEGTARLGPLHSFHAPAPPHARPHLRQPSARGPEPPSEPPGEGASRDSGDRGGGSRIPRCPCTFPPLTPKGWAHAPIRQLSKVAARGSQDAQGK